MNLPTSKENAIVEKAVEISHLKLQEKSSKSRAQGRQMLPDQQQLQMPSHRTAFKSKSNELKKIAP